MQGGRPVPGSQGVKIEGLSEGFQKEVKGAIRGRKGVNCLLSRCAWPKEDGGHSCSDIRFGSDHPWVRRRED